MFSDRIARLRKEKGLNQKQLAEKLGVSVDSVRRWEQGKRSPDVEMLHSIAQALDTTVAYIFGETDDANAPRDTLQLDVTSSNIRDHAGKRLIIKNRDMYVDLPETSEGFEMLRRFFDMQASKNPVAQTALMA